MIRSSLGGTFPQLRRPAPHDLGFPRSRGKCPKDKGGAKWPRYPPPIWILAFAGMKTILQRSRGIARQIHWQRSV